MPVNSRQKGKRGELEAVHFLREMGFEDAVRSAQVSGKFSADVLCPHSLPGLHVEIKYGYVAEKGLCVNGGVLSAAVQQAEEDAAGKPWVVLWRPKRYRGWAATYRDAHGHAVTVGEPCIKGVLLRLAGKA